MRRFTVPFSLFTAVTIFGLGYFSTIACMAKRSVDSAPRASAVQSTNYNLADLVVAGSDDGFSGYYLQIEAAMDILHMNRLQVHEVQNLMRDHLEKLSGSFSPLRQKTFLSQALQEAVTAVQTGQQASGYKPLTFAEGDFIVVFDWDETLIGQWYQEGSKGRGTLKVNAPDLVPEFVDRKTGKSLETPRILTSPAVVAIRPGARELLTRLATLPGFRGYVFFTAKEDKASQEVLDTWKKKEPEIATHLLGLFTRNHLRYDPSLKKASKDLRIFDPQLKHAFIIDDNEGRIMQKNLCYRIPKYNADPYYDLDTNPDAALSGDIKTLNEQILPYLLETLGACVSASLGKTPVPCFEEKLGLDNPPDNTELGLYLDYLRTQPSSRVAPLTVLNSVEKVVAQRIFEPGFFPASSAATDDVFPHYENFVVVDGSALIP